MTQLLRPSSRGQRSAWLTVHLFGAVGWVGAVAGSLALGMGITAWPVDAHAVAALNHLIAVVTWWVTVPCALACVASGVVLAQTYRRLGWPVWLTCKAYLAAMVITLGTIILATQAQTPAYLGPARTAGLLALCTALALSAIRPGNRRTVRVSPPPRHSLSARPAVGTASRHSFPVECITLGLLPATNLAITVRLHVFGWITTSTTSAQRHRPLRYRDHGVGAGQ